MVIGMKAEKARLRRAADLNVRLARDPKGSTRRGRGRGDRIVLKRTQPDCASLHERFARVPRASHRDSFRDCNSRALDPVDRSQDS